MIETIDRMLFDSVPVTLNGEPRKVTAIEAILSRLFIKAISGNGYANRTFLKYHEFASRHLKKEVELTFVENDYTRALANQLGNDDE